MFRHFIYGLAAVSLAFSVSCSSKKKDADDMGLDGVEISSEPLEFHAQGSDSGEIQGLRTVNFPFDSSNLDSRSREILNGNAQWMRTNSRVMVQIEGHCDNRGSVEYNLALGERRARAVRDYLVNLGIDRNRITIISYGKEKPLQLGDTEAVHSRNRRANFVPLAN